jgi:hypothetical protein
MQPRYSTRCLALGAIILALNAISPAISAADENGPFATLQGAWSGDGSIVSQGRTERIRCRAKYYVSPSGQNVDQQLRCASDSYHFDVNSGLVRQGDGSIAGTWTETTRNVTGTVSARVDGDSIAAKIAGPSFNAEMSMTTTADRQDVEITPSGGDISSVKITLQRT